MRAAHDVYPLTLLYDGSCPVCRLEMDELRARDAAGRLRFVDIAAPGFDPAPWGIGLADMNAQLHATDASGRVIRGMTALRLAYAAVGRGVLLHWTGTALLKPLFDAGYDLLARHRYSISRATAPLIDRIAARRAVQRMQRCASGTCER
jgi:predicted DCC family thiol-disulfide oxidoreductase YuxK